MIGKEIINLKPVPTVYDTVVPRVKAPVVYIR